MEELLQFVRDIVNGPLTGGSERFVEKMGIRGAELLAVHSPDERERERMVAYLRYRRPDYYETALPAEEPLNYEPDGNVLWA